MRKQAIHVKSYERSRHGRATFGGRVCAHNKSGRAAGGIERTFEKIKPMLIEYEGKDVFATTYFDFTKPEGESGRYQTSLMVRYSESTGGIGSMGAVSILDVNWKYKKSAEDLAKKINEYYSKKSGRAKVLPVAPTMHAKIGKKDIVIERAKMLDGYGYDFGKPIVKLMSPKEYFAKLGEAVPDPEGQLLEEHGRKTIEHWKKEFSKPGRLVWDHAGDAIFIDEKGGKYSRGQEGAHRMRAAKELGIEQVPVIVFDKDYQGMDRWSRKQRGIVGWQEKEQAEGGWND